jgi:hypothetical protein
MTRTLLALGLFTVVLAFAAPADGAQPRGAQPGTDQPPKNADPYSVQVTPEMQRHSHILDTLYFAGTAYGFVALGIVLVTGLSRRLRDAAQRVFKRPFLVTFVYFVLFSIVLTILSFPLDYYSGFVVPHQFDLTTQSFASWMGDLGKEFLVNVAIGGIVAALALFAIRKFARW